MFDWNWNLSELKQDKPVTVFSCFSCGGGSTMGYKRAGFRVLGNCEIDKAMNAMYKKNHHPKYNFNMDLRDFNRLDDLPEELLSLDILDGSPPCSTFSTAGEREKNWGREKAFREGQKKQTLDDLFFVFLDTVGRLRPKVVIAENVKGIVQGNAKGYCNLILKRFKELGYEAQVFLLNAAYMDIPQARERVFFVANRMGFGKLKMSFNGKPILFGEVRQEHGKPFKDPGCLYARLMEKRRPGDKSLAEISERVRGKYSSFNSKIIWDGMVCQTITANGTFYRGCDGLAFTDRDFSSVGSFPLDYDFCGQPPQYVTGMSVPPNMMANIAAEVYRQWLAR